MKTTLMKRAWITASALLFFTVTAPNLSAAVISKANNTDNLNLASSWAGGVAPGASDVGLWTNTVTGANSVSLGANLGLQGLTIGNPGGAVTIGTGNTLTLGTSGIDMAAASQNLTISSGLTLGAGNQIWTVNTGRTLTQNTGTFTRGSGATLVVDKTSLTGAINVSPTLVNGIIPYALVKGSGTAANGSVNGYTFATVSSGSVGAYTTAAGNQLTGGYTWTAPGANTVNYDVSGVNAIGSSRVANTIRYTGAAGREDIGNNTTTTFTINGILNAGSGLYQINSGDVTGLGVNPSTSHGSVVIGANNELVVAAANAAITLSLPIVNGSSAGAVTIMGPNTVTLDRGSSTFTGNLNVNSGTCAAGLGLGDPGTATSQGSALGNIGTAVSRSIIVNNGGTLSLTTGNTLGTGGSANTLSAITLIVNAGGVFQTGANASGAGWWNKIGAINLNGGTIHVGSGANNSNFQGLALIGTVTVGGSSVSTIDNLSSSDAAYNSVHLGQNATASQSITFNVADATGNANPDLIVSAKLQNTSSTLTASGLTKSGAGTMLLSGANSYTGPTSVSAGKLTVSTAGSGTSPITVSGGTFGVSVVTANGQWVDTSDVTLQSGTELDIDSGSLAPSSTVAPLKVANFTASGTDTLKVVGSGSFAVGTSYPLVTWTGTGPSDASGFTTLVVPSVRMVANLSVLNKTLYLNVTGNTEPLSWNIGNGTWDTSTANWVDSALTPASATYIDGSDSVLFGDAAGVSGNPTVTLNSTFSPIAVTVNSASHNYTLSGSGSLAGSGSLVVQNGTLTLATANSYTGGTTVSGGTLQISGSGTLGGGSSSLTASSGVLDLAGTSQSVGAVTITSGTIQNGTLTGAGISANNSSAVSVSANLGGTGGLTKSGNGTLTLTGANTYSGGTSISAGALALSGSGTLGSSANTLNVTGGTVDLGGFTTPTVSALTLSGGTIQNGTLTCTSFSPSESTAATISAILAGTFGFNHNTGGTLTFSGANTFSGTPTLTSGTLVMANPSGLGNAANAVTFPAGSTATWDIQTDGSDTPYAVTSSSSSSSSWTIASDVKTPGPGINHTIGTLSLGGLGLTMNVVAGPNVSGGAPKITTGTLTISSGSPGNCTINPTTASISIAGATVLNNQSKTLILGGTSTGNEITAALVQPTGIITVTKTGSSVWTISGSSAFTGGVNINQGVLVANNSGAMGAAGTIVFGGGTMRYGAGIATDFSSRFSTATSQPYNIDVNGNAVVLGTPLISSGGTLTVSDTTGGGSLTLAGANTYNGATTVAGGTLASLTTGSSASAITVQTGATNLIRVASTGGQWIDSANLTLNSGSELTIDFSGFNPSASVAPVKINGTFAATASTVRVKGAIGSFAVAQTYPLVTFGTGPSDVSAFTLQLPARVNGHLELSPDAKTLNLVIDSNTGPISWNTGSAGWDTSTANWVDALNVAATFIDGSDSVLFGDAAGAAGDPVVTLNTAVSPYTVTVNSAGHNYTITGSGAINGAGSLAVKNGSLVLSTTNTYTGGTVISGGTLQINGSGKLGATSGALTVSGGTLNLGGSVQTNGAVIIGNATIQNGVLTAASFAATNDSAATVSASFGGSGTLTKTGNGTLTLTASNIFSGNVFARAGTIVLDSGSINIGGSYSSVGLDNNDVAVLTLKGTGLFTNNNDFNLGDLGNSAGTLNVQDSALLSVPNLFVGSANANGSTAAGTVNQSGGSIFQTSSGIGTFAIGGRTSATGSGIYNLSGGTLTAAGGIRVGGAGTGILNVSGGTVTALGGLNIARLANSTGTVNLDGGVVVTLNITSSTGINATNNFNGATVKPTTNNVWISGLTRANVRNGGAILDTLGFTVTNSQVLAHSIIPGDNVMDGGVTKNGNGTLRLDAANTYTGPTLINNGTLMLGSSGSMANCATITIGSPATLNVSAVTGGYHLVTGQTLNGAGTLAGATTVDSGAIVQPGFGGIDTSTLTASSGITLAGTAAFTLNRTNAQTASKLLGAVTVSGGGLAVANNGDALQPGDTFTLFNASPSGTFASTNLPGLGAGQNWWTTNNYAVLILNQLTAGTANYTRAKGTSLKISVSELLTNVAVLPSAPADVFNVASVGASTNGATISTDGTFIFFTPANDNNESFAYTVTDARGGSASGVINVSVVGATSTSLGFSKSGNSATVSVLGIPNFTYALETATNLNGPWLPILTNTADSNGNLNFVDPNATNDVQFYRTAQP